MYFYMNSKEEKSLQKQYISESQRETDNYQSAKQSSFMTDLARLNQHGQKNFDLMKDAVDGEEGIDY